MTPSVATGTVQFKDGAANLGAAVSVTAGTATLSTNSLSQATHNLTAFFTPTDTTAFKFSTSNVVVYVLNPSSAAPAFTADSPPTTAAMGTPYGPYTFAATGLPPPTFSVPTGTLVPGLTLNPTSGQLSGTPTAAGSFSFIVAATNGVGSPALSPSITIVVAASGTPPSFTAASPPTTAITGSPYSYTFTASGNPAPDFRVGTGALPDGLGLDSTTGLLSGTPITAGTFTFTIPASNGVGTPATSPSITIVVKPGVVFTHDTPLLTPAIGDPYTYTFTATGDPAPTLAFGSGTLPPGLTFDPATGGLSGIPTTAGTFAFTISAANTAGSSATTPLITITVGAGPSTVILTPSPVNFGNRGVGTTTAPQVVMLVNHTPSPVTGIRVSIAGKGAGEFALVADGCSGTTVAPGGSCTMSVAFTAGGGGLRTAVLTVADSAPGSPQTDPMSGRGVRTNGYWLGATDGGIFGFGGAGFFGSTGSIHLNNPIVALAASPDGKGYWETGSDGGIFAFGTATFFGSTGSIHLNKPIVGMAPTPDGLGYWLVASDGGIFGFGTATFLGSTGSIHLNKPIVGMAATPDGLGYWLVASDGGLFSYGTAKFLGSVAGPSQVKPIVGMAVTPDGLGYWLVGADDRTVRLRDRPLPRVHRRHEAQPADRGDDAVPELQPLTLFPGPFRRRAPAQSARPPTAATDSPDVRAKRRASRRAGATQYQTQVPRFSRSTRPAS